ncbi:UDP-glycosyltransferase 88B1 [Dichanthelium oligosanthes]|uniref:UDP-glycosyltransferase 88B1 n=1 Tax=Dichanthelium oligosanthes TaxID=888268 RepID=A0A1E5VMN1_9POAL|nr:UDP-glycosyltransferase 88B1 [Dichanthelium oligosanthes]
MKKTVVLYPGILASHFVPMMQLADALQEEGYDVAVAVIDITMERDTAFAAAVDRAASSKPSVAFHTLSRIRDPPAVIDGAQVLLWYFEVVRRYNERLHDFICCSMDVASVHALVVDLGSVDALDVAKKLGIPVYTFYPTSASTLAVFLQLPSIRAQGQPSFRELGDAHLIFHGVPRMPASHLIPEMLEDPESEVYKVMMSKFRKNLEADGILVNTFASLEARAVGALRDPGFLPGSKCTTPPVYCVGPLVVGSGETREKHECIAWLDEQPDRSVVFLCFGILGEVKHSEEQLKEIAVGLEKSGHRFLWVVRAPAHSVRDRLFDPHADPDLDALLPEGFLERSKGRGLVVKLWAPQVDVLHHKATGMFVTHCGWNSVLEGITAGVPMLCWPLYSEQKMNKVFMVDEAGVGVEVVGWRQGLVRSEEVEAKVRLMMEPVEGEQLRARVAAHKEAAAMAWKDGGSSRSAFGQFLSDAAHQGTGKTPA